MLYIVIIITECQSSIKILQSLRNHLGNDIIIDPFNDFAVSANTIGLYSARISIF